MASLDTVNEDPSFTGPRPSQTIPNGGSFTVYSKVTINAPAEAVFKALIDISRWGEWNRMVPEVTVEKAAVTQTDLKTLAQGETIMLHVRMTPGKDAITKSKELVVQVGPFNAKQSGSDIPGRTIARWCFSSFSIKAEHVNWIDDNGDGTTTYQHWEVFAGIAAPVAKWMMGKTLQQHFVNWAEGLKQFAEKNHQDYLTSTEPSS